MARQYPIWNSVLNCGYTSSKSYGNKETGQVDIYVGSGIKNSTRFLSHIVTKRSGYYKNEKCIRFSFYVDGKIIKEMIFSMDKKGNAAEHLETISHI